MFGVSGSLTSIWVLWSFVRLIFLAPSRGYREDGGNPALQWFMTFTVASSIKRQVVPIKACLSSYSRLKQREEWEEWEAKLRIQYT